MASITRFLTFGLHLSFSRALICPSNFTETLGVCLHFPSFRNTWCEAQAYCRSVGGELVRGSSYLLLNGATFPGQPNYYWIGLTDLLVERGTSKSGWQWSDGSLVPPTSALWESGEPNRAAQDCAFHHSFYGKVYNAHCHWKLIPMCQPRSLPTSSARAADFQAVPIPVGLPAVDFAEGGGCSKLITKVEVSLDCFVFCTNEPMEACVAFYFNLEKKQCRLILHTDATVDMGEGWKKFVMKK